MPARGVFHGRIPRDEAAPELDARLERLAWVLEHMFRVPGTRIRFGLDAVAGLLPGIGDAAGLAAGALLLAGGVRYRVPASVLVRMAGNLLLDALIGAVPVLGDLFDVVWKANTRNLALLRAHAGTARSTRGYWMLLGALLAALALVVTAAVVVALRAIAWILEHPL